MAVEHDDELRVLSKRPFKKKKAAQPGGSAKTWRRFESQRHLELRVCGAFEQVTLPLRRFTRHPNTRPP